MKSFKLWIQFIFITIVSFFSKKPKQLPPPDYIGRKKFIQMKVVCGKGVPGCSIKKEHSHINDFINLLNKKTLPPPDYIGRPKLPICYNGVEGCGIKKYHSHTEALINQLKRGTKINE